MPLAWSGVGWIRVDERVQQEPQLRLEDGVGKTWLLQSLGRLALR